jgi:hypothetical protein
MSYLRYLCVIAHSGVQHILCCVFALFFFVLCILCCQFLWIIHLYCLFGILFRLFEGERSPLIYNYNKYWYALSMNNISLSDVLYMYIPVNFKLKMYASCALIFFTAGGLLVPYGIIRPSSQCFKTDMVY